MVFAIGPTDWPWPPNLVIRQMHQLLVFVSVTESRTDKGRAVAKGGPTAHPWRHRGHAEASGSMRRRSLTAHLRFCLHPRYRSVVWMETWPGRKWILFESAASQVTKPGARATKIVRGQSLDVGVRRRHTDDVRQPVRARVSASSSASGVWGVAWGDAFVVPSPSVCGSIQYILNRCSSGTRGRLRPTRRNTASRSPRP